MTSNALVKRDNFKTYFINFIRSDSRLKEAITKTYGPRVYAWEMAGLSRSVDLYRKINLFKFLKSVCPDVYINDKSVFDNYLEYMVSELDPERQDGLLNLLSYFSPGLSVPFILDNLFGGKMVLFDPWEGFRESLLNILIDFGAQAIPYTLKRVPLRDPDLVRVIVPYYIHVGSGSFKTLFDRVADLFCIDKEKLVEPFVRACLDHGQIPETSQSFLVRFFIIPSMDEYPGKTAWFLRKILSCNSLEAVLEHKNILCKHISRLLKEGSWEDADVCLDFMERFPIREITRMMPELLAEYPHKRQRILEGFLKFQSPKIRETLVKVYVQSSAEEKDLIIWYLLYRADDGTMDFFDSRLQVGERWEKALIFKNLWRCTHPGGKKWVQQIFEQKDKYLISAFMEKIHYLGNFFTMEEFNRMIQTAHQLGIEVNQGILNPLNHLLNEDLCRSEIEKLDSYPDSIKSDILSYAGFFANENMFCVFEKILDSPLAGHALPAMFASGNPRAVEIITDSYCRGNEKTKHLIVDLIKQFSDYRFQEIIISDALEYYSRVDSYTPGDAFLVPMDRETGFAMLAQILDSGSQKSVQLMLELARYGGAKAVPFLDEMGRDEKLGEIPRKTAGLSLARYMAGCREEIPNIRKFFKDEYLGGYMIHLMFDLARRQDTILVPTLEKYEPVDLSPFTEDLFRQLNNYYPWDPVYDQLLEILSSAVDDDSVEKFSHHLLGMFVEIKMPVLQALERLKNPATVSVLKDTLRLLNQLSAQNIVNLREVVFRISGLLHRMGVSDSVRPLIKFYRARFFRFVRNPVLFMNSNQYTPDLRDILDIEERREIFLEYFDRYLADTSDLRYNKQAFLNMIEGIKDDRFIPLIIKNLRLCQSGVDLTPSLQRLRELTGKTFGVEYDKWMKYIDIINN